MNNQNQKCNVYILSRNIRDVLKILRVWTNRTFRYLADKSTDDTFPWPIHITSVPSNKSTLEMSLVYVSGNKDIVKDFNDKPLSVKIKTGREKISGPKIKEFFDKIQESIPISQACDPTQRILHIRANFPNFTLYNIETIILCASPLFSEDGQLDILPSNLACECDPETDIFFVTLTTNKDLLSCNSILDNPDTFFGKRLCFLIDGDILDSLEKTDLQKHDDLIRVLENNIDSIKKSVDNVYTESFYYDVYFPRDFNRIVDTVITVMNGEHLRKSSYFLR